jgi:hypothetical protein
LLSVNNEPMMSIDPHECARLYGLAEQVYAGYGDYRVKAAAVGRQIPLFRLRPR